MGEIKSVKVDNWGVFFLQKLQNFFNKTDYCDLTLQFRDNSQLKVHRLVLSACTDYFNVLEQTCEVVDDAIIMPNGLQADVVVPIVNFMYTGTLEFELKMYNRLLRTAKDMNMTVLLKLLEAHRRTMEMHPQKSSGQTSPKPRRRIAAAVTTLSSNTGGRSLIQTNQGNKRFIGSNANASQNRNVPTGNVIARQSTSSTLPVRQIGSTTFTRIKVENEQQEINTGMSATSGYSLIKQSTQKQSQQSTSPFEQLRKGYNSTKRPAVSTFISPPAKKPNLEDVKEFAEQQRMRKQIAAEYGDDDYDANNIMDDDTIHNDDDDDEMIASSGLNQTAQTSSAAVQTVASSGQQYHEDPPGTTTIIVKHEGPDKPPTIVVKDSSNSKMNHAKIISEVLRQYPHLVKSNKNIKLKIIPNAGGQSQKIVVKKEPIETEKQMQPPANKLSIAPKTPDSQQSIKTLTSNILANRPRGMQQQQTQISSSGKPNSTGTQTGLTKSVAASGSATSAPPAVASPQKRRIDSKTMHALIALGAENTTGPWLCLRCGRNGHPISIPSYRGFRRHLINTHKEFIDPDLCENCGWRSGSKRELHFHMQLEHKIKTNLYIFPECQLCQQMCIDSDGLNQHLIDSHPDENKQQCIYCNKIFPEEIQLYTHMKTFHKKQALEDGIIDYSDDENQSQMPLPPLPPVSYDPEAQQELTETHQEKKVKILSNISLPISSSIIKADTLSHHHESALSTASEEYLQDQEQDHDNETKFVAADGSEVILTPEQRKEILSQLNQEHEGSGIVMVLNENQQQQHFDNVETHSDQGVISHDETSQATTTATNEEGEEEQAPEEADDQHDDNQIYNEMKSLHSHLDDSVEAAEVVNEENSLHENDHGHEQDDVEDGSEQEERAEHLEESKESIDNLEWAENLISEHDLADEVSHQNVNENKPQEKEEMKDDDDNKSQDEISKKLKELTGDWSENDDDMTEDPSTEITQMKETVKENDKPSMEVEDDKKELKMGKDLKEDEKTELVDNTELLASLQNTDKDEPDKHKHFVKAETDSETIDEDDIDMALKSLHKEDIEDEKKHIAKIEDKAYEENEKKDSNKLIESTVQEMSEHFDKSKTEKDQQSVSDEAKKNIEITAEKLIKKLETLDESEPASSTMEVDEETKPDLIKSLLSEQPSDAIESVKPAIDSPPNKQHVKENDAKAKNEFDVNSPKVEVHENEEFLDVSIEKDVAIADKDGIIISTTTAEDITSAATKEAGEASSTNTKDDNILSSEERVKSLISDWGDDDEDEDDNEAELTANL